jgi:hypothetical protein
MRSPEWDPAVAIHVNFGLLAAREATRAEIDRLARTLLDRVERVTIIAEARYEVDRHPRPPSTRSAWRPTRPTVTVMGWSAG